jgi:hypothetical protein
MPRNSARFPVPLPRLLPLLAAATLLGVASAAPAAAPRDPLWSAERLARMLDAYHGALPGKIRVLELNIYSAHAAMQVQDPAKPDEVNEYRFHAGKVSDPIPVRLVGHGSLDANLFDLDSVAIDHVPGLVDATPKQLGLDDAEVGHVAIRRALPFSRDVQIWVFAKNVRKHGVLKADAQGNVISAKAS